MWVTTFNQFEITRSLSEVVYPSGKILRNSVEHSSGAQKVQEKPRGVHSGRQLP